MTYSKKHKCYLCKDWFTEEFFYKDKSRPTGLASRCKECSSKRLKLYKEENPEKVIQSNRRREHLPHRRLQANLRKRILGEFKKIGTPREFSVSQNVGCSPRQLMAHLESQFEPGMTWSNYGNGSDCWSVDHIRPFSAFDLTNLEEQKAVNHYTNLRPMWHIANIKKGNKF